MPDQRIGEAVDDERNHNGQTHQLRGQTQELIVENQQQEIEAVVLDTVGDGAKSVHQSGSKADRAKGHATFRGAAKKMAPLTPNRQLLLIIMFGALVYIPLRLLLWGIMPLTTSQFRGDFELGA